MADLFSFRRAMLVLACLGLGSRLQPFAQGTVFAVLQVAAVALLVSLVVLCSRWPAGMLVLAVGVWALLGV